MQTLILPTTETVSETNKKIFENVKSQVGFVPNLYAAMAQSDTALSTFLSLDSRKSSLHKKEIEIVNLAASQVNKCNYCLSAHTALAKMNRFTDDEIIDFRKGTSSNAKYEALANLTKEMVENKGQVSEGTRARFHEVGYSNENLLDVIFTIAGKIITNFTFHNFNFEIDFPLAPEI